jgi:uncharacterized membrane protein YdbT with pleckstrin-like domain
MVSRRHWFTLTPVFIVSFILLYLPFVGYSLLEKISPTVEVEIFFTFLSAIYFMIWWQLVFYRLMIYWLDVWVITNQRIIDSRQLGYFNRKVEEVTLDKIQDVSVKTKGFFQTFLHYGDLDIQTAGTEPRVIFLQIPNPEVVKRKISELVKVNK